MIIGQIKGHIYLDVMRQFKQISIGGRKQLNKATWDTSTTYFRATAVKLKCVFGEEQLHCVYIYIYIYKQTLSVFTCWLS